MTDSSGSVLESQVDWLTCSAHGDDAATRLLDLAHHLAESEKERGNRLGRFRSMGYEGHTMGRVQYGQRDKQSTILRLSGDAADVHLSEALSVCDMVTRLDIAVTWRADPPDPHLGPNAYTLADLFHRSHPQSALPSHIQDSAGGFTAMIGKRDSENFLRLYNKEAEARARDDAAEAKRYAACWRYELEVKGGLSKQLAERVDNVPDRAAFVQQYVYQWCAAHGVEPAFGQYGGRVLLPGFKRRSDRETKLRNMRKNWRPTVQWFASEGDLEAVMDALGLRPDPETAP